MEEDYHPPRRRNSPLRNRSSHAAEWFHSDTNLEAVNRRTPNKSKHWQWITEDKSCFNLWNYDGRNRVRHFADGQCLPEYVIERYSGLTPGVMAYGVISYHGRSYLLRIECNLNSNRHVNKVLQFEVVPFFKSSLEPSFRKIMHTFMLQRLF
ncbi:uncharacterized protein TNCV_2144361 [Trichonephila clavipes]|nr:uncharacterized protein TNCV_2144361 [Trichonephila clavipes]